MPQGAIATSIYGRSTNEVLGPHGRIVTATYIGKIDHSDKYVVCCAACQQTYVVRMFVESHRRGALGCPLPPHLRAGEH
jgi:hypothetical protein